MLLRNLTIDCVRTAGVFTLDGVSEVENNVWLIGDHAEVLVVDASHDATAIYQAVRQRRVVAIVCTHGHNDHINAAVALSDLVDGSPVALHPADLMLWDAVHPTRPPDIALANGQVMELAGTPVHIIHTPGHSPGGVCVYMPAADVLFSGDTLMRGGPGPTGHPFSDLATILASGEELLSLPAETLVHCGHGNSTTIGLEAGNIRRLLNASC